MTLMRTSENKDAKFNLYFLGYPGGNGVPTSSANGTNPVASREGLLELTWNYGTESDPSFKYHNGNDQPQGFGHIGKEPSIARQDPNHSELMNDSDLGRAVSACNVD